ncbi:RHS repeat-associated core domain-containing protein, partial [Algoriphagus marincola]
SYLMYALYDQDSVLYDRGKVLVSNAAANEHEQLRQTLKVKKNGYLETFVVNETAQNIFFDNLKVQSTSPIIVQENAYYPFGMAIEGLDYSYNNHTNRYLYNGKELIEDLNLGLYDYGARFYDPVIGRWISVDPLAHLYPGISPYAYVANNPINAIDPDGRLIIFINGMHTGDGGKKRYWNGLDTRIMNRVGDHHARYYDGSMGGAWNTASRGILTGNNLIPGNRRRAGKSMGFNQAAEIFNSLGDGESIKIATHSMGAAYGKGFIQGLRKYAKKNNIDIADLIEFEVDLAPFQPTQQEAQEGVPTTVVAHEGDPVAGSSPMPGADNNVTRKGKKKSLSEHSVDSFDQREIDQFVPQSTRNRSGTSTWEQKPDKKND